MKSRQAIYILFILFSGMIPLQAQWDRIGYFQYPSSFDIGGSDNIALVSFGSNKIYSSLNGGKDWHVNNDLFQYCWYNDVDFISDSIAYVCGGSNFGPSLNLIAITTDGGITWDSLIANQSPGYDYKIINFINKDTGFVSQSYSLYRTLDGFKNLEEIDFLNNQYRISDFDIYKSHIILLCTDRGMDFKSVYVIRSADLGVSWDTIYHYQESNSNPEEFMYLSDIQYYDNQHIYIVGGKGVFMRSADGGETWELTHIYPYSQLSTVYFTSPTIGYINNAGGIYKTENGGKDWIVQQINPPGTITRIKFKDEEIGYALAKDGIYKTTNGGELPLSINHTSFLPEIKIYPNPTSDFIHITGIESLKNLQLFIYNSYGELIHTTLLKREYKINVANYPPGLYLLTIRDTKQGRERTEKIIIKR